MRIVSWNVNGIRAIYKKNFVNWLESDNADIGVFSRRKPMRRSFRYGRYGNDKNSLLRKAGVYKDSDLTIFGQWRFLIC